MSGLETPPLPPELVSARGRAGSGSVVSAAEAFRLLAGRYECSEESLSGWTIAENLTEASLEIADRNLRAFARRIAGRAVLRKAFELVGPVSAAKRTVRDELAEPWRGELDEEETLERLLGKRFPDPGDWVVIRREQRRVEIVLMMDTSLSMSGRNLALAAVAAAVLAFKVRAEDLAVVAFESAAKVLSRLGERDTTARIVDGILGQPARGFTNIEEALTTGRRELARGRNLRRVGLLITDGVYTTGEDPTPAAARFPRLHVLLTEDHVMDADLARRMARLGRGRSFTVKGHEDLPRRMLEVASRLLR